MAPRTRRARAAPLRARRPRSTVGAQHADWLTLIEPAGQFLTLPVLRRVFNDGLPQLAPDTRRDLRERAAATDWSSPAATTAWIDYLLRDVLRWGERLQVGPQIGEQVSFTVAEHGAVLRPEYLLANADGSPRVLVERYPPGTPMDRRPPGDRWAATPIDRTQVLCRALGVTVGVVTNGREFTIVYAPPGGVGGHATFDTSLFAEGAEAHLPTAFAAILGAARFFAVTAPDQLEGMLAESANSQADVTSTLGLQVRRAVELLVSSISRANLDADGALLVGVPPQQVYEAAATTVMRIVFLLYAEERNLLPLGEPLYDDNYAASTLYDQLTEQSDRAGDEPLELRSAAWQRLLATFRAVYAGITHDRLRMPPYGGGLFDPDRFAFLEGRAPHQAWNATPAHPLPVDDLTVREILHALQFLTTTEAGATESRRLSFRALDVEQIGHIYEGTLDHSALVAQHNVVGLIGKQGVEPEVELRGVEEAAAAGREALVDYLTGVTGKTAKQVATLLDAPVDAEAERQLRTATGNDAELTARLLSFVGVLREDLRGLPVVFVPGSVYVTETTARRDTGTEYTPRELAEEIVTRALEPLVYAPGPAQGRRGSSGG